MKEPISAGLVAVTLGGDASITARDQPGYDKRDDGVGRPVRFVRSGDGRVVGAGDAALRDVLPAGGEEGGGGR